MPLSVRLASRALSRKLSRELRLAPQQHRSVSHPHQQLWVRLGPCQTQLPRPPAAHPRPPPPAQDGSRSSLSQGAQLFTSAAVNRQPNLSDFSLGRAALLHLLARHARGGPSRSGGDGRDVRHREPPRSGVCVFPAVPWRGAALAIWRGAGGTESVCVTGPSPGRLSCS